MVSVCNNFQDHTAMKCPDTNLHLLNCPACAFNLTTKSHLTWKNLFCCPGSSIHTFPSHLAYDSDPSLNLIILTSIIALFNEPWEFEIMLIYWLLEKPWYLWLDSETSLACFPSAFHALILFLERASEVLTFTLNH